MKTQQIKPAANAIAYSYLRFSSPEQAKGDSVRRQVEMTKAWCEKNGVKYEESLSLRDEGISGYSGVHRSNPDRYALAGFLKLVEQKKVPKGSYFIIENLDRLTREDTVPAVNLFTSILLSGVRIVQLDPENIYTDKSDSMDVMRAVLEMSRGHSESANKSRRMSAVWSEKRKQAAEAGRVISRSCPAWMKVEGKGDAAKYVLIPARAEVVRRIFRMATDGSGARLIVKALVADEVPSFARKPWSKSYVTTILNSRQTFGEFTPRERGKGGHSLQRKPVGPPIADYYPACITDEQFFAAQAATANRREKPGRPAKEFVNVFTGIIWDARTQGPLHLMKYTHKKERVNHLIPYKAQNGHGKHVGFALDPLEATLFNHLSGIDPCEILPTADTGEATSTTLETQVKDTTEQLARIRTRMTTERDLDTLVDAARVLEDRLKKETAHLAEAKQREATPTADAWKEFKTIAGALDAAPDKNAARVKLRGLLRRMLVGVWCLFMPESKGPRVAHVQVVFAGEKFHHFTIVYRPRFVTNTDVVYPAALVVRELATAKKAGDIRDAKNACALEEALAAVPVEVWEEIVPGNNQTKIRSEAYQTRLSASRSRAEKWRKMRAKGMSYAAIASAETPPVSTNTVHYMLNSRSGKTKK